MNTLRNFTSHSNVGGYSPSQDLVFIQKRLTRTSESSAERETDAKKEGIGTWHAGSVKSHTGVR